VNFALDPDQELLRTTARRFLAAECPPAFVREMIDEETAHSGDLWRKLAELGWLGLPWSVNVGGQGRGMLDLAVLLEETGRALLPGPFFSSVCLGGNAVDLGGNKAQRRDVLGALAAGRAIVTLAAFDEPDRFEADAITTRARRRGSAWVLSGEKPLVPDAAVADWIVVAARTDAPRRRAESGITLFLVEGGAPGASLRADAGIDLTRRAASLRLDGVRVPATRVLGRPGSGWAILERVFARAAVAISAETVGVAARALETATAYAKERVQFGRPIGSFQAVQHELVDMLVAVESGRSLAWHAAWALDARDGDAPLAAAMAKAFTAEMGRETTAACIQIHGGTGFTWEHDAHLLHRRALANEVALGTALRHREAVASRIGL
jgi:alkylation response protein AidB-like acyl-CoA dehydrogenase